MEEKELHMRMHLKPMREQRPGWKAGGRTRFLWGDIDRRRRFENPAAVANTWQTKGTESQSAATAHS